MTNSHTVETTKICPICQQPFGPRRQDDPSAVVRAKARHAFKTVTYCGPACQGKAQRLDPDRKAKTRSGAGQLARRLCPKGPCVRCGETRQSQVHHKNRDYMDNRPENLERLCVWCHKEEHSGEEAHHATVKGWETKRASETQEAA